MADGDNQNDLLSKSDNTIVPTATELHDFENFFRTLDNNHLTFDSIFLDMNRHDLMALEKEDKLPEELKGDEQSINTMLEKDNIILPTLLDSDDNFDIDALISLYLPSSCSNQMPTLLEKKMTFY